MKMTWGLLPKPYQESFNKSYVVHHPEGSEWKLPHMHHLLNCRGVVNPVFSWDSEQAAKMHDSRLTDFWPASMQWVADYYAKQFERPSMSLDAAKNQMARRIIDTMFLPESVEISKDHRKKIAGAVDRLQMLLEGDPELHSLSLYQVIPDLRITHSTKESQPKRYLVADVLNGVLGLAEATRSNSIYSPPRHANHWRRLLAARFIDCFEAFTGKPRLDTVCTLVEVVIGGDVDFETLREDHRRRKESRKQAG